MGVAMLIRTLIILSLISQSLTIGAGCLPAHAGDAAESNVLSTSQHSCCCDEMQCCEEANVCACSGESEQTPAPSPRPMTQLIVLDVLPATEIVDVSELTQVGSQDWPTLPRTLSHQTHNQRQARLCTWQT